MSLTQVIKEAQYKTQDELEKFYEEIPENEIDEIFDISQVEGKYFIKFLTYLLQLLILFLIVILQPALNSR